ncbi:MAG TPA: tetraacyldisaccharide 4'-kinase [Chitinophagaceae bacterium]|nr:tetraacyldisaccharide 4'-kinase [Chitinophagaceae bacterium]
MNFNVPLLKPIRILLFPLSLLYALIIFIRNFLYDKKILSSTTFNLPLISVGNISVGGTGKSPMVEWLVRQLRNDFRIAVLSRGYKRKTKGYALAHAGSTALEIGDEPMQFHMKFPDVTIAVGEERIVAIPQLLHDKPETEAVLLDDAFQHRAIQPGFNILLTDCNNLYTRDWFLPTGDLRDEPRSCHRARVILVTKCPRDMTASDQAAIRAEISPLPNQHLYFTTLDYGEPYHIIHRYPTHITLEHEVLLVTGIANPRSLKQYLLEQTRTYYEMTYGDHHIFTIDDLREIKKKFEGISVEKKIIITTEKDAVRLVKFQQELKDLPVFVLPIGHHFLNGEAQSFLHLIVNFIKTFKR